MTIKDIINNHDEQFTSVHDLVLELSDKEQCSLADAAKAILLILGDHDLNAIRKSGAKYYKDNIAIHTLDNSPHWTHTATGRLLKIIMKNNSLFCPNEFDINGYPDFPESDDYRIYGWYRNDICGYFRDMNIDLWSAGNDGTRGFIFDDIKPKVLENNYKDDYEVESEDINNPNHPCYSKRLAATIECWKHVSEQVYQSKNKRPNILAEEWFEANHKEYDLDHSANLKKSIALIVNFREKSGPYGGWPES